jgi:hypothetical protein
VGIALLKGAFIAFPAVALGSAVACLLVFSPGVTWPGKLFFGWKASPPALFLNTGGTWLTLLQVAGVTLGPYLAAVLWPSVQGATQNPIDMLRED